MESMAELLREGISAAKAQRKDQAFRLLRRVTEIEPRNEMAWLWLSGVVETDEQRVVCLENVLAINPDNELAQKGLAALRRRASTVKPLPDADGKVPEAVMAEPAGGRQVPPDHPVELEGPVRVPAPTESLDGVESEPRSEDGERRSGCGWRWLLAGSGGTLVLVVIVLVAVWASGLVDLPGVGEPSLQLLPFLSSEPGGLSGAVSWETRGAGSIVVTGITVKVWTLESSTPVATGITDASGNYSITNIPPGEYRVSAHQDRSEVGEQIARKCWVIDAVQIRSGETTQVFLDMRNSLPARDWDKYLHQCT